MATVDVKAFVFTVVGEEEEDGRRLNVKPMNPMTVNPRSRMDGNCFILFFSQCDLFLPPIL